MIKYYINYYNILNKLESDYYMQEDKLLSKMEVIVFDRRIELIKMLSTKYQGRQFYDDGELLTIRYFGRNWKGLQIITDNENDMRVVVDASRADNYELL